MDRKIRAFTLTELLLAAAILAFALSSLLILFIDCFLLNENNRSRSLAIGHAQYVMEDIKNTPFFNVSTRISAGYWDWDSSTIESRGLRPLRNESINTTASGTDPLGVEVVVKWQSKGQAQANSNVTFETLFTE